MKKLALILIIPFMLGGAFEIIPALPDLSSSAEAARLGGGRSLGGRSGFNRSAPAPAPTRQATQAPASAAPMRGGLMGGMLGPILAGGILGALFFGGAFTGLRFIDFIVIGLMLWLVMRLLRSRRVAPAGDAKQGMPQPSASNQSDAWAHLRADNKPNNAATQASPGFTAPAGFDQEKFMEGARMMYTRMQESWDKRDLEDIRQFTTPAMYKLIEEQAKEDPAPSTTTILTMSAQPHEFIRDNGDELISVYFEALLREYADRDAEHTRELWHFARPASGGTWKLDGIQQVE